MSSKKWSFKMTPVRGGMLGFFVFSLLVAFYRYYVGLGSTNLSDAYPWGMWIGADLSVIALAGCGFSLAILTHIFHLSEFKPLSRRTLLMSFLGYILVLLILIIEIGRWDNFWRPFVSPGIHSPMFEVYMCIVAYLILQVIEVLQVATDKTHPKFSNNMNKFMPIVFIAACVVPMGHQSSLGAIYLAMPGKLDAIWSSTAMPWLFLLSAFFVGPAVAIIENIWSNYRYKVATDTNMLHRLAKISAYCMVAYFVIKAADLAMRGQIGRVFSFTSVGNMFILEMLLLVIVPVVIVFLPFGKTKGGLLTFSLSTVIGVILTRCNVVFTGMRESLGGGYFPNFVEIVTTLGFFTFFVLVYMLITENFPFFYDVPVSKKEDANNIVERTSTGYHQAI